MTAVIPVWLSRALAGAILLTLLSLVWGVLVAPLAHALVARFDSIRGARDGVSELRALIGESDELDRALRELNEAPLWHRLYEAGGNDAAGGALQQDFRTAAERAEIVIGALQPLESESEHGLRRLAMEVQFEATIEGLRDLLREVGNGERFIELDALTIGAPPSQTDGTNPALAVRMRVYGYSPEEAGT